LNFAAGPVDLPAPAQPSSSPDTPPSSPRTLDDAQRQHILRVLKQTEWRISGPRGAAAILGIKRTTLQARMRKLGIKRPI
jgi:formate hydrogenlyase transcriptional activator